MESKTEKTQAVKKRTNSPEVLKKASKVFYEKDKNKKVAITLNGIKAKKVKEKFMSLKPSDMSIVDFLESILEKL